jgi:uncharacterized membrane protein
MVRGVKRPLRITLLLGLVLITTALNLIRLWTAITWKNTLEAYFSPQELLYTAGTGAFWALAGIAVLVCYWRKAPYTRWIILIVAALYAGWYWLDRLFVQSEPSPNGLFALAVTVLLLGFTSFVILDRHNVSYFGRETHERKRENQSAT